MNIECQYCKKIFKNTSSLNFHQKNTKYCLEIQGKINSNYNCIYCNKNFTTKQHLNNHLDICKEKEIDQLKKGKEIEQLKKEKDKEIEALKKEKDMEIKHLKKELEKQERINKELQDKIERLATTAINRPTITTTNNTLNITSFIDFNDLDKVKNLIENKLDIKDVIDGQKGLARFVKNNLLTDDNGNLNYKCSDSSRCMFKYKDSSGEIKKDLEAKKLTDYILNGGIRSKSADIGNEWCKDDDGDINMTKFDIMLEQQQSIMKLRDDNTSFKKELASITS
jgi:hypothetical protein